MATSRLAAFFPVPRFMTLPSVSVDISDTSVKYLALERHGGRLSLAAWGELSLPAGTIEDGELRTAAAVAEALRKVRAATGADYARVALPEERAYLFETSFEKGLSPDEIRTALEFRLEENVPLPAREAVFAFETLAAPPPRPAAAAASPASAPSANLQAVSVTAYHRATAESYYAVCREAGLVPLSLEVEPSAIARAVVPVADKAARLILDFGKTRCGIGIVYQGVLMYTSTVEVGGRDLDGAIKALYPDADDAKLVALKNDVGLLVQDEDAKLADAIMPFMTKVKGEVTAHLSFWHSHTGANPDRKVSELILCGGLANVAGSREYFAEETGVETSLASVWRHIFPEGSSVPPITKRQSYGYATAIGLALGEFFDTRL